ncbi:hypothetical protein KPL74_03540 [Bacillus sp. NP157]|nr:hypothetical protein KPL74_03540 [Bacillus sp. NP157]
MTNAFRTGAWIVGVGLAGAWPGMAAAATAAPGLSADAYAVAAAVLRDTYPSDAKKIVLLGTRTATFACNPSADIGFDVGGCSGMRVASATADEVMDAVQAQLPTVAGELRQKLMREVAVSSPIDQALPTDVPQYVAAAPGGKKTSGDPEFAFYMSRPAISADGKRALIYVGIVRWNANLEGSEGRYVYLEKGKAWTVKGSARVWRM